MKRPWLVFTKTTVLNLFKNFYGGLEATIFFLIKGGSGSCAVD